MKTQQYKNFLPSIVSGTNVPKIRNKLAMTVVFTCTCSVNSGSFHNQVMVARALLTNGNQHGCHKFIRVRAWILLSTRRFKEYCVVYNELPPIRAHLTTINTFIEITYTTYIALLCERCHFQDGGIIVSQ